MPPPQSLRPSASQVNQALRALSSELAAVGVELEDVDAMAFPIRGNYVDHDRLFNQPSQAAPATPARIWRLSPYGYREFVDALTHGRLIVQGGPAVRAKMNAIVTTPFGLTDDPGFRDYAFRYQVSGSETQQLALNARIVLDAIVSKRLRYTPPRELSSIVDAEAPPSLEQIHTAVRFLFELALLREPTADELTRYADNVQSGIERMGNRDGLIHGLVPVLLHPEAVFRSELGGGKPDRFGRVMLTPLETAMALAYALTDLRPDAELLTAARNGKLATKEDVSREVSRLLDDSEIEKPRILRFFREYFDYYRAPDVFKDPVDLKAAGISGKYTPDRLVEDTDLLVLHILADDRDVFRRLLTTTLSFVDHDAVADWLKFAQRRADAAKAKGVAPPTHPFGDRNGKNQMFRHYNFEPEQWSTEMPLTLAADQRAGILTQPSWLIAHSANTENHAIHRGKWIRERLLGGVVPDVPITVEAKLPDEPQSTLRERMRVTRVEYCAKCHTLMDPLGLPFEVFDHFGQFRTTELNRPVDSSGEIRASGEAQLDGPVTDALDLIRKLAESKRVEQVFVRHAFRFWMGRNETLDDGPTLQAAHQAYVHSQGSMKALIASLLTSDSFLYRIPNSASVDDASLGQERIEK